jgi:predicted transport protein
MGLLRAARSARYGLTMATPDEMMDAVSATMMERTGRTLDDWVAAVRDAPVDPLDQRAVRGWLKEQHGIKQNSQWAIAFEVARQAGWVQPTPAQYAAEQWSGAKAPLLPIFEAVRDAALSLGDDVTMEGRSTYVPFVRGRQFAAVAAATRTRVDLGLRLPQAPTSLRLQPASAPGQCTHKLSLTSVDEVDDEVRDLLRAAYEQNGR